MRPPRPYFAHQKADRDRNLKRQGQLRDVSEGDIAATPLDICNIGAMEIGPPREFLLREAQLAAPHPYRFTTFNIIASTAIDYT